MRIQNSDRHIHSPDNHYGYNGCKQHIADIGLAVNFMQVCRLEKRAGDLFRRAEVFVNCLNVGNVFRFDKVGNIFFVLVPQKSRPLTLRIYF